MTPEQDHLIDLLRSWPCVSADEEGKLIAVGFLVDETGDPSRINVELSAAGDLVLAIWADRRAMRDERNVLRRGAMWMEALGAASKALVNGSRAERDRAIDAMDEARNAYVAAGGTP